MEDIAQVDIFFLVTTIAVVVVATAIVVVVYHVVKVIQEILRVVRIVEREIYNLTLKRRKVEVHALTAQKVVSALFKGALFRNRK